MSCAILVSTHGHTSEHMIKTVEMIMGEHENISFVNFIPGENTDDLTEKYMLELKQLDRSEGVLVMVDLFGGSPFNAISLLALNDETIEVVTGVNIPMLLETLVSRNTQHLKQLVNGAKTSGMNGISILEKKLVTEDDLEGDDL